MPSDPLSLEELREQLPSVLARYREGERTPVEFGDHDEAEAVVIPAKVYRELTAERAQALREAVASVEAEGLTVSAGAEAVMERWARGEIEAAEMHALIRRLHGLR